jgi:hypothetical protein
LSPKGVKGPEPAAVSFAHLILSLEDPAALVQALDQRVGAVAATAS